MKVKKYPQSHLVITSDSGKKLIIDPGYHTFRKGFKVADFQGADVYLITHIHDDHLGPETIKEVVGDSPVYGNSDTVEKLKGLGINCLEVKDRQEFKVAGFKIRAVNLPHFKIPDDRKAPINTGFVIDEVFFHAGDGYELTGLQVDNAALAIGHPSLSFLGVLDFAKSLGVKVLIPIHYDAYLRDPEEVKKASEIYHYGIEIRPLRDGEETTV
jgi:L-ascorbate metabolism protein UlaG (beta-lactamase superfamily)